MAEGVERLQDSAAPRRPSCRSAAPRWAPASTRPRRSPAASSRALAERTGLPLTEAPDHFAAQGARDALVEASGQLRTLAVALIKIANDIRWMGCGPADRAGRDPPARPAARLVDHARQGQPGDGRGRRPRWRRRSSATTPRSRSPASQGNFELNVFMPMMARNLLESIRLLANVSRLFADRCVDGIEADEERCRAYAESSPVDRHVAQPVHRLREGGRDHQGSVKTGARIRELVLEQGLMSDEELDRALDVLSLTKGGIT